MVKIKRDRQRRSETRHRAGLLVNAQQHKTLPRTPRVHSRKCCGHTKHDRSTYGWGNPVGVSDQPGSNKKALCASRGLFYCSGKWMNIELFGISRSQYHHQISRGVGGI